MKGDYFFVGKTMPKKEINLLPREDFEKRPIGKFLIWSLTVGRWIVVVTELIVILAFLSRFKLDRDLTNLYESIREKQNIIAASAGFEKDFRSFQTRLSNSDKIIKNQLGIVEIISAVSSVTPPEVALTKLSYSTSEIQIAGQALSEMGLKTFLSGLKQSSLLTEVNLGNINQDIETDTGIKFTLTAKIKKPEEKK